MTNDPIIYTSPKQPLSFKIVLNWTPEEEQKERDSPDKTWRSSFKEDLTLLASNGWKNATDMPFDRHLMPHVRKRTGKTKPE